MQKNSKFKKVTSPNLEFLRGGKASLITREASPNDWATSPNGWFSDKSWQDRMGEVR